MHSVDYFPQELLGGIGDNGWLGWLSRSPGQGGDQALGPLLLDGAVPEGAISYLE